jgi:hypothetical protein
MKRIYAGWMAFAHRLQVIVTTVLFGAIYLVVVPLFALVAVTGDTLRLRRSSRRETFWVRRRPERHDDAFFDRM